MRTLLLLLVMVTMTALGQDQPRARFEPPTGKQLLVIGQDLGAIGGLPKPHNDGYTDHIEAVPGGVTAYTDLATLSGLARQTNLGAGDSCAQTLVDSPTYANSVLAIGLYMVGNEKRAAEGKLDRKITELATWIRDTKRPVLLRIGYEFDGSWNHYDPTAYKLAYQRIVDRLRELKVDNCATVWQASTSPVNGYNGKDIADWYPGDAYVDWIGYSWFLSTPKQEELTDTLLAFARAHGKPVMLCESAPQGYDLTRLTRRNIGFDGPPGKNSRAKSAEEIWAEWFAPYFAYLEKHRDTIRIVAYINVNWDAQRMWGPPYRQGYWGDSRVQGNPALKAKWLEQITQPHWLRTTDASFTELGFPPAIP